MEFQRGKTNIWVREMFWSTVSPEARSDPVRAAAYFAGLRKAGMPEE
jgi:hypothetical protein